MYRGALYPIMAFIKPSSAASDILKETLEAPETMLPFIEPSFRASAFPLHHPVIMALTQGLKIHTQSQTTLNRETSLAELPSLAAMQTLCTRCAILYVEQRESLLAIKLSLHASVPLHVSCTEAIQEEGVNARIIGTTS